MNLRKIIRNGLNVLAIYVIAMICILIMAEKVERLNEIDRLEKGISVAVKNSKWRIKIVLIMIYWL